MTKHPTADQQKRESLIRQFLDRLTGAERAEAERRLKELEQQAEKAKRKKGGGKAQAVLVPVVSSL